MDRLVKILIESKSLDLYKFFLIDIKLEWGGYGEELMGRTKPQLRQAPVTFFQSLHFSFYTNNVS